MAKITSNLQVSPQDIFVVSTVQETDLGAKVVSSDGRSFRYVKAGAVALVAGKLQQAPAIVANHQNVAVAAVASAGAKEVTVKLGDTAATVNQYAGGILVINDVDGQGFSYTIKSHPAAGSAASLVVKIDEEIQVALTISSQASLIANLYNGVIVNPTTATNVPIGVAILNIAAGSFGWIQTQGAVSCLNDAGTAVGLGLAPSGSVAGALATVAATTNQVASALQTGVDTEYNVVNLCIN